ncbi:unnamed protein product [Onchocerca flexuosa]|uniref:Transposase n=1 Tax=Onchocerca flexuosa TaxID=387005 RepID=A0A183I4K1_9BILA|nr:unnamed protein product [Onchocerca flexuosa]
MLLVTARLVGNDEPQKSNTTHRRSDTTSYACSESAIPLSERVVELIFKSGLAFKDGIS